jgi:hypothetical protein
MKVKKLVGASNLLHLDCDICCYDVQAAIKLIDENGSFFNIVGVMLFAKLKEINRCVF